MRGWGRVGVCGGCDGTRHHQQLQNPALMRGFPFSTDHPGQPCHATTPTARAQQWAAHTRSNKCKLRRAARGGQPTQGPRAGCARASSQVLGRVEFEGGGGGGVKPSCTPRSCRGANPSTAFPSLASPCSSTLRCTEAQRTGIATRTNTRNKPAGLRLRLPFAYGTPAFAFRTTNYGRSLAWPPQARRRTLHRLNHGAVAKRKPNAGTNARKYTNQPNRRTFYSKD